NSPLDPFVVRVVDAFAQPVSGATVNFAVTNKPTGATNDSLTVATGTTDSTGTISTTLRLGNASGDYEVTASLPSLPGVLATVKGRAGMTATKFAVVDGGGQPDSVRTLLNPFSVVAKDDNNLVVSGVLFNFTIVKWPRNAIGYSLTKSTDTTNSSGLAGTQLQFGNKSGEYWVEVASPNIPLVKDTIKVRAIPRYAKLVLSQGDAVVDTISATLNPFVFILTDADTNGIMGKAVQFAITQKPSGSSLDSLTTVSANTNDSGYATTQLRLGERTRDYYVTASLANDTSMKHVFKATANPGRPAKFIANNAATVVDTIGALIAPFTVSILDRADNGISNTPVNFVVSVKPGSTVGDSLTVVRGWTDSAGTISSQFRLGLKSGPYHVSATADTLPGAVKDFFVQANPGVPSQLDSINFVAETKPILQPLDSLFRIQIVDRGANPIAGEQVRFTISTPSGASGFALSDTLQATDAFGMATTRLTLGDKVGTYTVTATSQKLAGRSRQFPATALHGAAKTLARLAPDQRKTILQYIDTAFTVFIADQGGNPVAQAPVRFSVVTPANADSTMLSVDSARTDNFGKASVLLKLGTKIGTYVVTAKSSFLPNDSIRFVATATYGAARTLIAASVQADTAEVEQQLKPFVVTAMDIGQNLVPKAPVQFAITAWPSGAQNDSLTAVADTTDTLGRATVYLTLGNLPGLYEVTSYLGGVAQAKFVGKATFTPGDPNSSGRIDIADLTQMIDHIIGRIRLTGVDSMRADLNQDGAINILDLVILESKLLTDRWAANVPLPQGLGDGSGMSRMMNSTELTAVQTQSPVVIDRKLKAAYDTLAALAAATTEGKFEFTNTGVRFNLINSVPIRGIQITMKFRNPVSLSKADVVFSRASKMSVLVASQSDTVRVLLFNLTNTPIDTGYGALFRLAIGAKDTSELTSYSVVVSTEGNRATYVPSTNVDKVIPLLPMDWVLYQNYPNPFNPTTTIEYDVPEVGGKVPRVAIQIFNILGQKVRTIERTNRDAGHYKVIWDGRNDINQPVASGVYIYRLLTGEKVVSKKMIMLK
ncbi:MAG: T9SS type A sorting domain-containing protein, partial [Ignavibacteriales bacterium]|nr:T9SS type A sorting domain-containing protein [Ignavibacteriales bacterium]